jgi:hypothetical protein
MDFKERATEIFAKHLEQWESDPKRMENGYRYEATYAAMMEKVEQEVLQLSVGKVPKGKNSKKNSRPGSGR